MDMDMDTKMITAGLTLTGTIIAYFKSRKVKKAKSISNHSIFYFLDDLERDIKNSFKVPRDLSDAVAKQEAFRSIMIHKIRIWRALFVDAARFYKTKRSLSESRAFQMRVLDEGIEEYSKYYTRDGYTPSEQKALGICMEKFNAEHLSNADYVSMMIESTHTINEYLPVFDSVGAAGLVLDAYKYTFHKMLIDINKAIRTMNGDLKGLKFKRRRDI